jgi:hypothetical protein
MQREIILLIEVFPTDVAKCMGRLSILKDWFFFLKKFLNLDLVTKIFLSKIFTLFPVSLVVHKNRSVAVDSLKAM